MKNVYMADEHFFALLLVKEKAKYPIGPGVHYKKWEEPAMLNTSEVEILVDNPHWWFARKFPSKEVTELAEQMRNIAQFPPNVT